MRKKNSYFSPFYRFSTYINTTLAPCLKNIYWRKKKAQTLKHAQHKPFPPYVSVNWNKAFFRTSFILKKMLWRDKGRNAKDAYTKAVVWWDCLDFFMLGSFLELIHVHFGINDCAHLHSDSYLQSHTEKVSTYVYYKTPHILGSEIHLIGKQCHCLEFPLLQWSCISLNKSLNAC